MCKGRKGEGRMDHPEAQRFFCPQLLEKLGCSWPAQNCAIIPVHTRSGVNYKDSRNQKIIKNSYFQKIYLLPTFVLFSCPSPQTVISGGGWNQWWRVESGILKTHSVFLPLPAHFVKNISDKKYYSVEGNVILWEWIWMEIINVFIIKELKHAVLKHLSLCSFDQNSLIENTSQKDLSFLRK